MYTRNDLTVTRGTSRHGGPQATATVTGGPLDKRVFELTSTEGLEKLDGILDQPQIHVHEVYGDRRSDWHGALHTADMDEAIGGLVEHVNDLAARQAIQEAAPLYELRDALSHFEDSLGELNRRDFRAEWENVKAAVVAMESAMRAEPTDV